MILIFKCLVGGAHGPKDRDLSGFIMVKSYFDQIAEMIYICTKSEKPGNGNKTSHCFVLLSYNGFLISYLEIMFVTASFCSDAE